MISIRKSNFAELDSKSWGQPTPQLEFVIIWTKRVMSKQSNAFQKLIYYIHNKIEFSEVKVTESALLRENNIDQTVEREVDILIEKQDRRIAIECRDRSAKDDIQWIDGLIGKYKNLDVDKVIAVSNFGFSQNAYLKAKMNSIDLQTLEDAMKINFGEEFKKLGFQYISLKFEIKRFSMCFEPSIKIKPPLNTSVFNGEIEIGTLEDFVNFCFEEGTKKKTTPFVKDNMPNFFKTKSDTIKQMLIEHTIPVKELYIEQDGSKHFITSITITLLGTPFTQDIQIRHRIYKDALITEGIFDIEEMPEIHTTWIAQLLKDHEAKVFVKSKPKKQK